MNLAVPSSALSPMCDTLITVRAPQSRNDVAEPWEFMAWLNETNPYTTGAAAGSGIQATSWQVGIPVEQLHGRAIVPGSWIDPVPERHAPRLHVEKVQYNGPVVHLTCSARQRAV